MFVEVQNLSSVVLLLVDVLRNRTSESRKQVSSVMTVIHPLRRRSTETKTETRKKNDSFFSFIKHLFQLSYTFDPSVFR